MKEGACEKGERVERESRSGVCVGCCLLLVACMLDIPAQQEETEMDINLLLYT